MVAKPLELDATSSPSNRSMSALRDPSRPYVQIDDDHMPEAVYAVTGDETTVVIVQSDFEDSWDDPPLDYFRHQFNRVADWHLPSTDYLCGSFHSPTWVIRDTQGTEWLHATGYLSAAFGQTLSRPANRTNKATNLVGQQLDSSGAIFRTAQEAMRAARYALAELTAGQSDLVRTILEAIALVQRLADDTELGAILDELGRPEEEVPPDPSPWAEKVLRLKRLAALSDREIAKVFNVSRSNVQAWLHRGQGMRPDRQQHLLSVLGILEDAYLRLGGDSQALRQALLTPAGPDRKTPFESLTAGRYRMARGYLQTISQLEDGRRADRRRRSARRLSVQLPEADRLAALDVLSPPPQLDADRA